jgi:hypothetical protein
MTNFIQGKKVLLFFFLYFLKYEVRDDNACFAIKLSQHSNERIMEKKRDDMNWQNL